MQYSEDFLSSPDGHQIPIRVWRPEPAQHVLVIAHGMAEYCERYAPLAEWLTLHGVAVVALNHRGHGMDCPDEQLGHYADLDGWSKVLSDLKQTTDYAKLQFPNIPLTLFGHSMGSFIIQSFIQTYPNDINRIILSASNRVDRLKIGASKMLVGLLKRFQAANQPSAFVTGLAFAPFNKKFKPNRTEFDWISRDNHVVDEYVADPYCGFDGTLQMWEDFLGALLTINPANWPKHITVHLLAGTHDPVGEMGSGVRTLENQIRQAGLTIGSVKLYDGGRHEIVNETNRKEVWQDILTIVQSAH